MATRLDLSWHDRASDIPEGLWRACFSPPGEGLFWLRAIEAGTVAGQFKFQFGLLEQDGVAIGIVPAFLFDLPLEIVLPPGIARGLTALARGPLRRIGYLRTLFVGNVAGEEGQVGLLPGHALSRLAPFVHDALRAKARALKAPMLVWKDFPASERVALDELARNGRVFRTVSYPGTAIPLVRGGYAAFLATVRADRRWKINDKLRRGARTIAVATTIVGQPGSAELDEIFALFMQTAARGKIAFERLTPEFFRTIAACDESTFIVLRDAATKKMLAFMLMFDLGERVINQFIGIDYTAGAGAFLYFRLFAVAYDWACTTQAGVMQSGQTGYMAKLDLGHTLIPLWNYCEHRNPAVNWMYRRIASEIGWDALDSQLREYLKAHPEARVVDT
ncbi:MAG: hypothetical protein ABI537_07965 [Casimicrobiaceae bacterium]